MDRLDGLYYEAIISAADGTVEMKSLLELHKQASKFAIIEMRQDSARFYERLYQIWRTLRESDRGKKTISDNNQFFHDILSEYQTLLRSMGRSVRADQVEADQLEA